MKIIIANKNGPNLNARNRNQILVVREEVSLREKQLESTHWEMKGLKLYCIYIKDFSVYIIQLHAYIMVRSLVALSYADKNGFRVGKYNNKI